MRVPSPSIHRERAPVSSSSSTRLCDERLEAAVEAARGGEEWAFTALYRDIQPSLLGYLRSRTRACPDDLASETWVRVATDLHRFRGDASGFRGWVFTIARCRTLDATRRYLRRTTYTSDERVEHLPLASSHLHGDPESAVVREHATQAVLARIDRLSADQADVVLLRVVSGLASEEVAAVLGKTTGAVRVLQHRALRRLAEDFLEIP